MERGSDKRRSLKSAMITSLLVVVIGSAVFWIWPSKPVKLNREGYAIATALYRVCNQQDVDGLHEIDAHVRQATDSAGLPSNQQIEIFKIIHHAQSGNWDVAMKQCRFLLEDQVENVSRRADADARIISGFLFFRPHEPVIRLE